MEGFHDPRLFHVGDNHVGEIGETDNFSLGRSSTRIQLNPNQSDYQISIGRGRYEIILRPHRPDIRNLNISSKSNMSHDSSCSRSMEHDRVHRICDGRMFLRDGHVS